MKKIKPLLVAALAVSAALPAAAVDVVLGFEGIWGIPASDPNQVPPIAILDFYGGAATYAGQLGQPGQVAPINYNVTFGSSATGIRNSNPSAPAGGPFGTSLETQFANNNVFGTSSNGVLGFYNGLIGGTANTFTMSVPNGFTSLKFQYATTENVRVEVFGLNSSNALVSLGFDDLNDGPGGCSSSTDVFCDWLPGGVSFTGTATEVRFTALQGGSGTGNWGTTYSLVDDVKFTMNGELPAPPPSPAPEPSTYALMALGLLGIGIATRRRRALND